MNRGSQVPRHTPCMSIGATVLSLNRRLVVELTACPKIRLEIEDGRPVMYPDAKGCAVIRNARGFTGMIAGSDFVKQANKVLGKGSRWIMVRDARANCWRGKPAHP